MTVSADHFHSRTWDKHRCRIARRITKDYAGGSTNDEDFYFNENYQIVEVRKNSDTDAAQRFLWDVIYIDAPAMVEIDTNTDGTRDYRLWPTFDGNFNVTALVTDQGKVVERYAYTPYGQRIILNGSRNYADSGADADGSAFTVDTNGSDFSYGGSGFQGLWFDAETGQWWARSRPMSPVMQFTQRDKIGYAGGTMNLLGFVGQNPVNFVDPSGHLAVGQKLIVPSIIRADSTSNSAIVTTKSYIRSIGNRHGFPWYHVNARLFAAATDRMYSENPLTNGIGTGDYRLFSEVSFNFDCCASDSKLSRVFIMSTTGDVGWEGPLQGHGGFTTMPRPVAKGYEWATYEWTFKGMPNQHTLMAFNAIRPRTAILIRHEVQVTLLCNGSQGIVQFKLAGSSFPSHRLWINGGRSVGNAFQGAFSNLWRAANWSILDVQ